MVGQAEGQAPKKSLLDLIDIVDNVPFDFENNHAPYYRFFLDPDPRPHGYIHPTTVANLPWPSSFTINHDTRQVHLTAASSSSSSSSADASFDADHANAALQQAVDAALSSGLFPTLSGLHSEPFRIPGARGFVHVERFAATLFGIATRGSHMTVYQRGKQKTNPAAAAADGGGSAEGTSGPDHKNENDDDLRIWVARRSKHLHTYPSKLDSTVAGGIKAPDSPLECILAESSEEASLPRDLVSRLAIPTGTITLSNRNLRTGLFHSEMLHCYDMELPLPSPPSSSSSHSERRDAEAAAIVPVMSDGEVEEFMLMTCGEVRTAMERGEFKPNVCAVMIDFMIRHGVITPESEGEGVYTDICSRLKRRLPVPLSSDI